MSSQAIGWVRVQVRDPDAEAAGELLSADLTDQLPRADGDADPCPSCGTEWHYIEKGSRWLLSSLMFNPLAFFAFLAVPRWKPRLVCRNCGRSAVLAVSIRPERMLALLTFYAVMLVLTIAGVWLLVLFWKITHLGPTGRIAA
jgi:hypothetical protein